MTINLISEWKIGISFGRWVHVSLYGQLGFLMSLNSFSVVLFLRLMRLSVNWIMSDLVSR